MGGRCPGRSTCDGGGPYGETVSPLESPLTHPQQDCPGGGGEAPVLRGGGRAWATVIHFILGTEGFMRILGQDLEKEKGRR